MRKYGLIDIGTNSMRLLLATMKEGKIIERKKYINTTRIGRSVDKNKLIGQEGIERNIQALGQFVDMAREYGAGEIRAIATSAVREARNREDFIKEAYKRTGIKIRLISGEEEADLGYRGAILGIGNKRLSKLADRQLADRPVIDRQVTGSQLTDRQVTDRPVIDRQAGLDSIGPRNGKKNGNQTRERTMLIDIGGGSTELIIGQGHRVKKRLSLDIGAVRMTERFISEDPVSREGYEAMEEAIREAVKGIKEEFLSAGLVGGGGQDPATGLVEIGGGVPPAIPVGVEGEFPPVNLIGIGGTITSLAALHQQLDPYDPDRVHNYKLTLEDIASIKEKLLPLRVEEIKKIRGIHPKRADIILAGLTILHIIMKDLDLGEITVSEYDSLEGLLY